MSEPQKTSDIVRNVIGQFVEDMGADSVVIIWSSCEKEATRSHIATWGNQFAVRDMIKTANDDYIIDRLNKIKTTTNPKPKDNK